MPFESFLSQAFEFDHENEQFQQLAAELEAVYGAGDAPAFLLGNVMCDACEFDALFIKEDAFCVIEMKSMGGDVRFTENGPWKCDGTEIMAGKHVNPYRQVSAYRFAAMTKLSEWEREGALLPATRKPWGHVSACVLFGPPTTMKGRLPKNVKKWFSIEDLTTVGGHLEEMSSKLLKFNRYDFNLFIERFGGVDEDERVRLRELARSEQPGDLVLDRQSDVVQNIKVLRVRGGPSLRVAQRFEELLSDAAGWADSLGQMESEEIASIKGARRYRIAAGHSLVVISHHLFSSPVTIGIDNSVTRWIEKNAGAVYTIDPSGKISKTYLNAKGDDSLAVTSDNLPLLQRIDLDLEALVPAAFIRNGLLELNEESSDEAIDQVVEAVGDESVQSLLSDMLYRLRSGDSEAALARLELFEGESIEVAEISGEGINPDINSENLIDVGSLDPEELHRLLDPENFAEWMVFLHPEQRRIARTEYQKRALLTGVSGSGKTCVLVHRARHLATKYPDERIGILTLNRNLSHLLNNLVTSLCTPAERKNIFVYASYDYLKSLVDHYGPDLELENLLRLGSDDPEFGSEFADTISSVDRTNFVRAYDPFEDEALHEQCWQEFMQRPIVRTKMTYFCDTLRGQAAEVDPEAYLKEEFSLIRSGCLTAERESEYLDLKRQGRAIRLQKKDRINVLNLLLLFEETLLRASAVDELGLTLMVTPHMRELPSLPDHLKFRCLLIDEFQDLSTRDLAVLQRVVPQDSDALFLTGDMVQQVMVKTLSLPRVGYARGSYDAEHIHKNYRNSRHILTAANDLVLHYGQIANQQNDEMEILDPEFAIRETAWPKAIQSASPEEEISAAWEYASACVDATGAKPWSVCIVTTNPDQIPVRAIIAGKPTGQPFGVKQLSGDYAESENTMTVGTMSDVKGFEFSVMVIVGCGKQYLPIPGRANDEIWRDALRLYVAMTRARDLVYLIYSGEPSEIVTAMSEHIDWENEA